MKKIIKFVSLVKTLMKYSINNFKWSESFDFPASWAEEGEDQLTRQFKPEFQGCPQRETRKGPLINPAYSIERQRRYLSVRDRLREAYAFFFFFRFFFQTEHIFSIALPRPATQDSFTSGPDIRSYRKSALRGTTRASGRRDRERDVKVKSDFPSQPVRRRVPGDEGWSNPAGERACASWQARPVQGHRAAHAAQSSLRPAKRPGALYWNSADRLSWLYEERSRRPALSTIARICLNAIARSYSILSSFEDL